MPLSNGPNSMFVEEPFDYGEFTKMCQERFGLTPRYTWVWDYFGGLDINWDFKDVTNVIFTNGQLDPWRAGGLNVNVTENWGSIALIIDDAAHHLDLRLPNDEIDPDSVKQARLIEI